MRVSTEEKITEVFTLGQTLTDGVSVLQTAAQKRRAFWLVDQIIPSMQERALMLRQRGIEVHFFTSIDGLMRELDVHRAGIIIVSDHELPKTTQKVLQVLMNTPEIQGAKMIYVCDKGPVSLRMLAAGLGFRDIIPADLGDKEWLQRMGFATSSKPQDFPQPSVQTSIHSIAGLSIPTRLIWISEHLMRIECRARPPVGSTLNLSGPIADAIGVNAISLTVRSAERTNLLYRFSDALVCEWSVPQAANALAEDLLKKLKAKDPGPRCRAFVAVQNSKLRRELIARFDDPRFEVAVAIQKHSIEHDPKFFSPDLVLIESGLVQSNPKQFDDMMRNLPEHSAVILFGRMDQFPSLRAKHAPRPLLMLTGIPKDLTSSALNRFMPIRQKLEDATTFGGSFLRTENPLSIAEVSISARLSKLHPSFISLQVPFPIGKFALIRVDSPFVRNGAGRNLMMKVTRAHYSVAEHAPQHLWQIEGYLADASINEQKQLAEALVSTHMDALQLYRTNRPGQNLEANRTPVAVPPPPTRARTAVVDSGQSATPHQRNSNAQAPAKPLLKPIVAQVAAEQATNEVFENQMTVPEQAVVGGSSRVEAEQVRENLDGPGKEFIRIAHRFAEPAIDLTGEPDQIKMRDEIAPILEAAGDLKDEFVQGIREGVQSDIFKSIVGIFLIILGLVVTLWVVANHIAPAWHKSGATYSDQLKELAPYLKNKNRQTSPEDDSIEP